MKKQLSILIFFASVLGCVSACSLKEDFENTSELITVDGRQIPSEGFETGMVRLRFTEALASKMEADADEDGLVRSSSVKSVNDAISSIGITKMYRTFPYAGEHEERTRYEGLHLWYDVYFDESIGLTRAGDEFRAIEGVSVVEYRPKIRRISATLDPNSVQTSPEAVQAASIDDIFNDPFLSTKQWHYYNDGKTLRGSIAGADINVLPAWERGLVGSSNVVVSVVDGGIDYKHEDLAANMWENPKEPGTYGANFSNGAYNMDYYITPDKHGTHVAGTIGAVNNNGKGVAGIAGGNYEKGIPGVRLMSCQIFGEGKDGGSSGAAAIKWGADNGAVISQNSWGYDVKENNLTEIPKSDKDAIDYFIKYAGMVGSGNNLRQDPNSPMAGGIVIFAAGNEKADLSFPGAYEACLAVTAIAADFRAADYTNYGSWCDVMAPGGDAYKSHSIYSTLPNNNYGAMEGTSMACPHVSGMAALLVSRFGGPGFTNENLKELIMKSLTDISEYMSPSKYLGQGLINVGKSINFDSKIAPEAVTDLTATTQSNNVDFTFTVPKDEDDKAPAFANLYYSTKPFEVTEILPSDVDSVNVYLDATFAGRKFEGRLTGLEFHTKYYISIDVTDWSNNHSAKSALIEVETGGNTDPVIKPVGETEVALKSFETKMLDFSISDPDGHAVEASLKQDYEGLSIGNISDTIVRVTIDASKIVPGTYTADVVVTDAYGASASLKITYSVMDNHVPVFEGHIEDIVFNSVNDDPAKLTVSDYFTDEDNETLIYRIDIKDTDGKPNTTIVRTSLSSGVYSITPLEPGIVNITIFARDASGEEVSSNTFKVMVRASDVPVEIYPNPVIDVLNFRTGVKAEVDIVISNSLGVVTMTEKATIAPFEPLQLDLSKLPGGTYLVKTVIDGTETEQSIVKL